MHLVERFPTIWVKGDNGVYVEFRPTRPMVVPWIFAAVLMAVLVACGGGGSSGSSSPTGPVAPFDVTVTSTNGKVTVDWTPIANATGYRVYWSLTAGVTNNDAMFDVMGPPAQLPNLPGGVSVYVAVASLGNGGAGPISSEEQVTVELGDETKYFPSWADAMPMSTTTFTYNPGLTSAQNGANLHDAMQGLQAGQKLEVGGGTYTIDQYVNLSLVGTEDDPIWIVAKEGEVPVITRSNNNQNTVNLGSGTLAEYLCLRGLEITGGDIALRLYNCRNVWVDQCEIHHCAQNAVAANAVDTEYLYFTRNEVHDTAGVGEGFYIGGNHGNPIARYCVVALNHVYNTGGSQGDGIEIKQGSYGNWIAENVVHDCNYPCILVYGTYGEAFNIVERNLCYNSGDNVMQVQGEAIVRNNVLINGSYAFSSHDHQDSVRDLTFVHNTVLNGGTAVHLSDWNGRAGMVLANNAIYSENNASIDFSGGSSGVTVIGNVVVGPVDGVGSGFVLGNGLTDFVAASFDGSSHDVTPTPFSPLLGAAEPAHAVAEDYQGNPRIGNYDAGAVEVD